MISYGKIPFTRQKLATLHPKARAASMFKHTREK